MMPEGEVHEQGFDDGRQECQIVYRYFISGPNTLRSRVKLRAKMVGEGRQRI